MIYTVRAVPWERGWELHIDGEGVTQVRTLDKAANQVRDYLESLHDRDFDFGGADDVIIDVQIPQKELIESAKTHAREAAAMQAVASREMREAVTSLRNAGFSVTDTAAALGVSRGRVSQLESTANPEMVQAAASREDVREVRTE